MAKPHFDVAVRLSLKTEVKKLLSTPAFFSSVVTLLFNNVFYQRACVTFLLWLTYQYKSFLLIFVSLVRFSFSFALAFLTPSLHLYALLRWHVFVSTVCACLFTFSSTSSSQLSLSRPCLLPSLSNVLLLGIAMLLSWRSTPLFLSEISLVFPCGSVQTPWLISLRLQVWSRVASTVQSHCKEPSLAPCPSIYLFSRLLKCARNKPHIAPLLPHI